jgi:hypothetical protein
VLPALGWLERLAGTRRGAVALFLLALAAYAVRAIGWPVGGGRDLDEYLYTYVQLFDRDPLLPWSMLFRTPVTPVVAGVALDLGGGTLAGVVLAVLYALSIVAWSAVALAFGRRTALVTAVALLLYQGYALMFHELSSEPLFAAAFAGWALALTRAVQAPTTRRFAVAGLAAALVVLVRPGGIGLLAFSLLPLVLARAWRTRLRRTGAYAAAAVVPLVAWGIHNGLVLDKYTLARGGNAVIPLYRAFITDHIVESENGPASRKLAKAMQDHLLTREPYRSYGVTLDELFRRGSFRVHEDLYLLSDQVFGWDSDYSVLRKAGIEAVRAHPGRYASGVLTTIWQELSRAQYRAPSSGPPAPSGGEATVVVGGRSLPKPSEGEPIPGGQTVWISRPDNAIRQVWTSPTEYHFEFDTSAQHRRFDEIQRRMSELSGSLSHGGGNEQLSLRLNQLSRWYPRPIHWLALGLIALALRRPREWRLLVALPLGAMLYVVPNALGHFTDLHFLLPVAPAFVFLGVCAALGSPPFEDSP